MGWRQSAGWWISIAGWPIRDGWPGGSHRPRSRWPHWPSPRAWADTIDWSRSAARAVGAGHVYVNLRGRDPHGTVEPGAAYDALVAAHPRGIGAAHGPGHRPAGGGARSDSTRGVCRRRGSRRLPTSWSRSRPALPGRGTRCWGAWPRTLSRQTKGGGQRSTLRSMSAVCRGCGCRACPWLERRCRCWTWRRRYSSTLERRRRQ